MSVQIISSLNRGETKTPFYTQNKLKVGYLFFFYNSLVGSQSLTFKNIYNLNKINVYVT